MYHFKRVAVRTYVRNLLKRLRFFLPAVVGMTLLFTHHIGSFCFFATRAVRPCRTTHDHCCKTRR